MSVLETVLVFGGIPLAIVLVLALLTLVPGREKRLRYKPGQSWDHPPVWYEPRPLHGPEAGELDAEPKAMGSSVYPEPLRSSTEDAAGATAATPAPAGPLGGARGTW